MQQFPRMDQQHYDALRRACKEAALRILPPGASISQTAVVTEKIYLAAASEALGSIAAAMVLGDFHATANPQAQDRVANTLDALNA